MTVSFYAIKIKNTDLFKGQQKLFCDFKTAITDGCFSNSLEAAEKKLKEYNSMFKGGTKAYPNGINFRILNDSVYYCADLKSPDFSRKIEPVTFMDIELEIIELKMSIA
jgi:hypothetical protein